jgi:hypothetical protein
MSTADFAIHLFHRSNDQFESHGQDAERDYIRNEEAKQIALVHIYKTIL